MSHYQHLSIEERESIWEKTNKRGKCTENCRRAGSERLHHQPELKRNQCKQGYRPSDAQKQSHHRRKQCRRHRLLAPGPLRATVVRLLTQQQWSPEQISERMADGARETASQLQHHLSRLEGWVYGAEGNTQKPARPLPHAETSQTQRLAWGKEAEKNRSLCASNH